MSVYLSRIQLNPHRRDARRLLASPQRMHAAVLASFPDPVTGAGGGPRVLWRLDQDPRRVFLYVVSPDEPDFAHLAEQGGWPSTERGLVKPYDGFLDRLEVGQQWAFRLAANPTHWGTHPDTGRVQRFGILSNAGQERWLTERAARHGFAITTTTHPGEDGDPVVFPDLVVSGRGLDAFHRPDPGPHRSAPDPRRRGPSGPPGPGAVRRPVADHRRRSAPRGADPRHRTCQGVRLWPAHPGPDRWMTHDARHPRYATARPD